jgi:hypothetical protein
MDHSSSQPGHALGRVDLHKVEWVWEKLAAEVVSQRQAPRCLPLLALTCFHSSYPADVRRKTKKSGVCHWVILRPDLAP